MAAALALAPGRAEAQFFKFQDNSLGYHYSPYFREPAVVTPSGKGRDISKNIVTFTHVDAWNYGSNFVNLDYLKSSNVDPEAKGSNGASEFYLVYRGQLSPDSIFGMKLLPYGPIRDVTFEAGFDWNTKNTQFGSHKWLLVVGPNIHFNVPGFLNLGIHYAHEWNRNGIVDKDVSFGPTLELEASYSFPLAFTGALTRGAPLRLEGFTNLVTPKGRDGFGSKTATEILSQTRLTLDLGDVLLHKASFLDVSVGFQYWYNKFGNDHTKVKGSIETAPFLATRVHF